MRRQEIAAEFRAIQDSICRQLEALDGTARFGNDPWTRPEGGGGLSRPIADGALIEKGGVNFSEVFGPLSSAAAKSLKIEAHTFYATGVSVVLHARNPWVPTIHMNIRYFEAGDAVNAQQPSLLRENASSGEATNNQRWFGGGIDLTPAYVDQHAAALFHSRLKETCDRWDPRYYPEYKRSADDYFFLPHRNETRGIGGIFFDRLAPSAEHPFDDLFAFTRSIGHLFAGLYAEVAGPVRSKAFTQREKDWQLLRRGRYVEFNLVHDRGTRFGLETGGRTESILMSLPPEASWRYDHHPEDGSPEEQTLAWLRKGVDWSGL